jgi:hypothetical protein
MNKIQRAGRLTLGLFCLYAILGCFAYIGNLWQVPREKPRDFGFQKKVRFKANIFYLNLEL